MCFGTSKTDTQKTEEANAAADRGTRDKEAGQLDPTLGYFMGKDPTQTGLYKSLVTGGTQATNEAYDNAKAANRLHSRVAGFGYEQPLTQASDEGVELGRAGQLSDVPRTALLSTIGPELQAAGLKEGEMGQYNTSSLGQQGDATQLEKQRMANQAALLKSLMSGATGIASMFLPGAGAIGGMGSSPGADAAVGDYMSQYGG